MEVINIFLLDYMVPNQINITSSTVFFDTKEKHRPLENQCTKENIAGKGYIVLV